jgi:hypothetical protein
MRNIPDKFVEEIKTNILCSVAFFYEMIWKNIVQTGRSQMTIWRMHIAFWIPWQQSHIQNM